MVQTTVVGSGETDANITALMARLWAGNTLTDDQLVQIKGEIDDSPDILGFTPDGFNLEIEPDGTEGVHAFSTSDALVYTSAKGGALLSTSNSGGAQCIRNEIPWDIFIHDVQMNKNANNGNVFYTNKASNSVKFERVIFRGGKNNKVFFVAGVANTITWENCVFEDITAAASIMIINSGTRTFINNTFVSTVGSTRLFTFFNLPTLNFFQNLILGFDDIYPAGTAGSATLNGGDLVADDTGLEDTDLDDGSRNDLTATVGGADEIESPFTDMRLKTGAISEAFISAANKHADTPTDDILGQTRGTSNYDAGCYALTLAAGGGPFPVELLATRQNTLSRM